MVAEKSKSLEPAPRDAGKFNKGLEQIFKNHNIPMGKDVGWLVKNRSTRNVAKTYILTLEYCRRVLDAEGQKREVLEAAREKGDMIVGKINEFLKNGEVREKGGWGELESSRDGYLSTSKKVVLPEPGKKKETAFTRVEGAGVEKLRGTKISKAELSIKEVEGEIARLEKELEEAEKKYRSEKEKQYRMLWDFVDKKAGVFTSREEVVKSPEYKKREKEMDAEVAKAINREYRVRKRVGREFKAVYLALEKLGRKELEKEIARLRRKGEETEEESRKSDQDYWGAEDELEEEFGGGGHRDEMHASREYEEIRLKWNLETEKLCDQEAEIKGRIAKLEKRVETLYWTQEERKEKIKKYLGELLAEGKVRLPMDTQLGILGLFSGGMSDKVVGSGDREAKKELDDYILEYLRRNAAKDLCMYPSWNYSKNLGDEDSRRLSAELLGLIAPDDDFVTKQLIGYLKTDKSGIVRAAIVKALIKIAEEHGKSRLKRKILDGSIVGKPKI